MEPAPRCWGAHMCRWDAERAAPCFTVTCFACVWPFTVWSHRSVVSPPCREMPGDKQEGYALQIPHALSLGGKAEPHDHPTKPTSTACTVTPKPSQSQGRVPAGAAVPGRGD